MLYVGAGCAFIYAGVREAMRFDKLNRIKYSHLQGKLAAEQGFSAFAGKSGGTMVLMRESDGKLFLRSDAVIELARALGGWWCLFLPAKLMPRFLRDAAYKWVARHRYWFSKKGDFCLLPDPEMMKRILE